MFYLNPLLHSVALVATPIKSVYSINCFTYSFPCLVLLNCKKVPQTNKSISEPCFTWIFFIIINKYIRGSVINIIFKLARIRLKITSNNFLKKFF